MSEPSLFDRLLECGCRPDIREACDLCRVIKPGVQYLRAKLQAAEALNEEYRIQLLMADKISGDQRSRAEAAEARIVELETAVLNWYEWSTNDSNNDAPLDTINEIALLMLDQEPKVNP